MLKCDNLKMSYEAKFGIKSTINKVSPPECHLRKHRQALLSLSNLLRE